MAYNIIFYFTDQQRADTCGCFGQPLDITPNLDRLAGRESSSTWPSRHNRSAALPGVPDRALRHGDGVFRNNIMLPGNVKTLADYIEGAGYETAYIGKWHLASDGELESAAHRPYRDRRSAGAAGGYTGYWRAADVLSSPPRTTGTCSTNMITGWDFKGYRVDCITDLALDFFKVRDKEKPFRMTISHIEPHHQNDRKAL